VEDCFEELTRWYLRFNGFLSIENFIIHEPAPHAETVPQGAEIDKRAAQSKVVKMMISNVGAKAANVGTTDSRKQAQNAS